MKSESGLRRSRSPEAMQAPSSCPIKLAHKTLRRFAFLRGIRRPDMIADLKQICIDAWATAVNEGRPEGQCRKRAVWAMADFLRQVDHIPQSHRRDINNGKLPPITVVDLTHAESVVADIEDIDLRIDMESALNTLDMTELPVIALKMAGVTNAEIAEELGSTEDHIKWMVERIYKKLRRFLAGGGYD